jgi:hypothetical protein
LIEDEAQTRTGRVEAASDKRAHCILHKVPLRREEGWGDPRIAAKNLAEPYPTFVAIIAHVVVV